MKQSEKYDWDELEFPVKLKDIHIFEKKNNVSVHVLSYCDDTEKVYPLRLSKHSGDRVIILFYYDEHYSTVKNLSRLVGSQLSKNEHKKFICLSCLSVACGTEELLEKHQELCQNHDHQVTVFPESYEKWLEFNKWGTQHRIPFVAYADFEAFLRAIHDCEGNPDKSFSVKYNKHEPSGFCYLTKCFEEGIFPGKTVLETMTEPDEDMAKRFMGRLEEDAKELYKILSSNKDIIEGLGNSQRLLCL